MIVETSLKSLLRRRGRTALALAGIAVSSALLLDMTMLASGLTTSFRELTSAEGYGMRVTPRGTLPFDSEAGLEGAAEMRRRIGALEGVRDVAPVLGAQLYTVAGDTVTAPAFTTGVDPAAQMIYRLDRGSEPAEGEVVISGPLAEASGLEPGDRLTVAAELDTTLGRPVSTIEVTVSGVGEFLYDAADQQSIAIPLSALQRLTGRTDEVSLFAIATEPEADQDAVAARIEAAYPEVSAYSSSELTEAMDQRLAYFRQLSTILGTISLAVATLLAGTILTIGVRERYHEIATLRAIGIPASRLQISIVVEGIALTTLGCLIGAPLAAWMAGYLDRILLDFPGVPARVSFFVFEPLPSIFALGILLAAGATAGLIPARIALTAPLGTTLREEAD